MAQVALAAAYTTTQYEAPTTETRWVLWCENGKYTVNICTCIHNNITQPLTNPKSSTTCS